MIVCMLTLLRVAFAITLGVLLVASAGATSVPSLSFDELTYTSDLILSGHITNSWVAWEPSQKYIWTHYQIEVESVVKGSAPLTLEIAEPGGHVGGVGMAITGSVGYERGERVLVFLQRMPNGYLRTAGWGQGKYLIGQTGLLHAVASLREDTLHAGSRAAWSPRTLEGLNITEVSRRIAERVQAIQLGRKAQ